MTKNNSCHVGRVTPLGAKHSNKYHITPIQQGYQAVQIVKFLWEVANHRGPLWRIQFTATSS